ncbi:MAG: Rrf2 family transcriptional regulator [Planctomycetota bacterium]
MLALTKKTDYALIALSELARREAEVLSVRELSERHRMPLPLLTNILKNLTRAGIVVSVRGVLGGYRLARSATTINLHELIAAVEGPFQFVRCATDSATTTGVACELETSCPIRLPAHRIRDRLRRLLEEVTLAEIVDHSPQSGVPLVSKPLPVQLRPIQLTTAKG